MKPLYCANCKAPHDIDLAPDTGECVICGGPLIEDETERGEVGPDVVASRMVEAVNDGLMAAVVARGAAPRGAN